LAFFAGNGEVTAADNGRVLGGSASALDLPRVARIELKLADGAVSLEELNRNDGGTSVENELTDDFGFGLRKQNSCHGKKEGRRGSRPVKAIIACQ